ncbi:MAG: BofC C-terminal domain-containing protein [Clostridia bacterium]|nr:BofC C-terminal domain-containing protein [Clostridia bacterium]
MYQVQKRRRSVWFYIFLFASAFAVGLGIGYAAVRLNFKQQQATKPETLTNPIFREAKESPEPGRAASTTVTTTEEVSEPEEQIYFVVEQSGRVRVFLVDNDGKRKFSHNLSIELDALRAEDRKLFSEGITVYSKEELSSLVEDFSS